MQVSGPAEVVPLAAPCSLIHRLIVAVEGLYNQPPAVRCPAESAVTAVPPVVTAATSKATMVRAPGEAVVNSGVIDATPCTVTAFAEGVPAMPGAEPAMVVISCPTATRAEPSPTAPAPANALAVLTATMAMPFVVPIVV